MSAAVTPLMLPFTHYARLGYLPCPVQGKVPAHGEGWYSAEYNAAELKALDASGLNVGLRCSNIIGLDIDVTDAKVARKVEATVRKVLGLPKATPRRVGKAPKALLICRVEEPMSGFDLKHDKREVLFQLLGSGKQFVIHGTHPETLKPYMLDKPLPAWSRLPLVTQEQVDEMRVAVALTLTEAGYDVSGTQRHAAGRESGAWTNPGAWTEVGMTQAWEALEKLDPDMVMDDWVKVGMALHDGTHGSEEGLDLWDEWSKRASEKYKGRRDLARRWRGFRPGGGTTTATLFRNDFARMDDGVAAETVFLPPVEMDGGELFDFEAGEVPWLVDGLMTHGAHLLAGRPKGGKSWITMDMAYAVGHGGAFLGKPCKRARVLWIASEDTKASLSRRMKLRGVRPQNMSVYTMEALAEEAKKYPEITFDAWLREYLVRNRDVGLVIMDTHATIEARWQAEEIEDTRKASPTDKAYQKSRIYEEIGHETETCIVLVHHTGKLKNNHDLDYHERINMPQTVVAGATASFVVADLPDRDQHDEDNHRRIFAMRGRHIERDTPLMIELGQGRVTSHGEYTVIRQSEAQAVVFEAIEAILEEAETTTMAEVAKVTGMSQRNVAGLLGRCKRDGNLFWKGRRLLIMQGRRGGLAWASPGQESPRARAHAPD